jgi:prepilin-type N-terminal cleavage/methylation domain-containing protein
MKRSGFTLIEILLAIAIIGILAAVILISLSGYRASARSSKLNSSLSSVVTSLQSCWAFGGQVNAPSNNAQICTLASSYGNWPDVSQDGYSYSDISYAFLLDDFHPENYFGSFLGFFIPTAKAAGPPGPSYLSKTNWYFSAASSTDNKKVCCNQKMSGCKIIEYSNICGSDTN